MFMACIAMLPYWPTQILSWPTHISCACCLMMCLHQGVPCTRAALDLCLHASCHVAVSGMKSTTIMMTTITMMKTTTTVSVLASHTMLQLLGHVLC